MNLCVCCGAAIPEGRMVCKICLDKSNENIKRIIDSLRLCADQEGMCNECNYYLHRHTCTEDLKKDAAAALEELINQEEEK